MSDFKKKKLTISRTTLKTKKNKITYFNIPKTKQSPKSQQNPELRGKKTVTPPISTHTHAIPVSKLKI